MLLTDGLQLLHEQGGHRHIATLAQHRLHHNGTGFVAMRLGLEQQSQLINGAVAARSRGARCGRRAVEAVRKWRHIDAWQEGAKPGLVS